MDAVCAKTVHDVLRVVAVEAFRTILQVRFHLNLKIRDRVSDGRLDSLLQSGRRLASDTDKFFAPTMECDRVCEVAVDVGWHNWTSLLSKSDLQSVRRAAHSTWAVEQSSIPSSASPEDFPFDEHPPRVVSSLSKHLFSPTAHRRVVGEPARRGDRPELFVRTFALKHRAPLFQPSAA